MSAERAGYSAFIEYILHYVACIPGKSFSEYQGECHQYCDDDYDLDRSHTAFVSDINITHIPFLLFCYNPNEIIAGVVATRSTDTKSSVMGKRRPNASLSCFFLAALRHRFQQDEA